MSLEVTCKVCGEEFDMRHKLCPACKWRIRRIAQLEAENERLHGRIEHAELFDSELPNSAYGDDELINGVDRTWGSLNDTQRQFWIDRAHKSSEVSDE